MGKNVELTEVHLPNSKRLKRARGPLRRYPRVRKFTNPLWIIPIIIWILLTIGLCVGCIFFADWKWLMDYKSLNSGCSSMHRHLISYLLNYQSFLIALAGAATLSLICCIIFQNLTKRVIIHMTYVTVFTCTVYTVLLWFLVPDETKLTCGQSLFSIIFTLAFLAFVFMVINYRKRLPLVVALHLALMNMYRDLPSITIGLVFLCIGLNVLSIAIAVAVLEKATNIGIQLLVIFFAFFFMVLEGWIFLIINTCNKFVSGYVVGLWYFAKDKKRIKGAGRSFTVLWYHIATISSGSIYLFFHMIFKPIIDSVYYGYSSGVEGILKSIITMMLQPFKNTYDTINIYGFYLVAIYGLDYYSAMQRSYNLKKIGEKCKATPKGDALSMIFILFVSSTTLLFGLIINLDGRMRWWKHIILLFFTGLWVSMSFLLTFMHMNAAFYMCVCMDYEIHGDKKEGLRFPKEFNRYLQEKEEYLLTGRLNFSGEKKDSEVFKKEPFTPQRVHKTNVKDVEPKVHSKSNV